MHSPRQNILTASIALLLWLRSKQSYVCKFIQICMVKVNRLYLLMASFQQNHSRLLKFLKILCKIRSVRLEQVKVSRVAKQGGCPALLEAMIMASTIRMSSWNTAKSIDYVILIILYLLCDISMLIASRKAVFRDTHFSLHPGHRRDLMGLQLKWKILCQTQRDKWWMKELDRDALQVAVVC